MTDGERHIDIEGYDRDLKHGKQRLAFAIERERNRSIRAYLAGKPDWRPRVTPEMLAALRWLYARGRAHALAEMRSMGVPTSFAERKHAAMIRRLIGLLGGMLGQIGFRIHREAPVLHVRMEGPRETLLKAMEKRVPGALDAASRLVSTAIAEGLSDAYLERVELFEAWMYTAVLDSGTCEVCRSLDGTVYDTWAGIMAVLPGGGPNPRCFGDGRCRCRIIPVVRKKTG